MFPPMSIVPTNSRNSYTIFLIREQLYKISVAHIALVLKHGASLYLKFEVLNLSIVIIFKTFHWLKNDESYSVVSAAVLCLLPASEKGFYVVR